MAENDERTLPELLADLKAAVEAGDRVKAMELHQRILQRLATEYAAAEQIELDVNCLLGELDANEGRRLRMQLEQRALQQVQQWQQQQQQSESPWPHSGQQQQQQQQQHPVGSGFSVESYWVGAGSQPRALGVDFPVWFGTNRQAEPGGKRFGAERSDRTTLGQVWVHVPRGHQFGEVGASFWQKVWRLNFEDDALKVVGLEQQTSDEFFGGLVKTMQAARDAGQKPQAVVFLHGFNVEFDEAAIRAAQIGYDLGIPGATAFFSWPSRGKVWSYTADEAAIEASEQAIADFLIDFTGKCGAETVHLIAHSMGNRGLLRALQRIAGDAQARGKVKFGQIFLAAPDVDRELFLQLAHVYRDHCQRATLYSSRRDWAVMASAWLHGSARAGYFTPYTISDSVDTIAVPDFNVEFLGHGYFSAAEALLYDIRGQIDVDKAPPRQRMTEAVDGGKKYWELRK